MLSRLRLLSAFCQIISPETFTSVFLYYDHIHIEINYHTFLILHLIRCKFKFMTSTIDNTLTAYRSPFLITIINPPENILSQIPALNAALQILKKTHHHGKI